MDIYKIEIYNSFINSNFYLDNLSINYLVFNSIKFKDKNDFLNIISKDCNINEIVFYNSLLNGLIDLSNLKVNSANFNNSRVETGNINLLNFDFKFLANRYTALLLKQESYKNHNTVEALKFYAEEMRLHRKEINKDIYDIIKNKEIGFFKKFLRLSNKFSDNFSLYSAYIFSNNGLNWIQALFFTFVFTFISFTIFYTDLDNKFSTYFFEDFIKYIIPTNYDLLYKYVSLDIKIFTKICGVIVYFFGKIVFGYGFYHIVISFKKFLNYK